MSLSKWFYGHDKGSFDNSATFFLKKAAKFLLNVPERWKRYIFLEKNIFGRNDPVNTQKAVFTTPWKLFRQKPKTFLLNVQRGSKDISLLIFSPKGYFGRLDWYFGNAVTKLTNKSWKFLSQRPNTKKKLLILPKKTNIDNLF